MSLASQLNLSLEPESGITRAEVHGPLNRETIPVFQQRLDGVARKSGMTLALDLGDAEYLDSDGVRWLQRLQKDLTSRQIELRLLVNEGSRTDRVLKLLQLDQTFQIDRPSHPAS